jgi:hypothetical protein
MDERELAEQLRSLASHLDAESRTVHPVAAMERPPGHDPQRRRQLIGATAAVLLIVGLVVALVNDDDGRQPVDAVTPPTSGSTATTTTTTSTSTTVESNTFAGTPPEEWPESGIVVVEDERAVVLDYDGTELGEVRGPIVQEFGVGPERTILVVGNGPSFEVDGPSQVDAPDGCDTGAGGGGVRVVLCGGVPQLRERIVSVDPTGAQVDVIGPAPGSLDAGHWRWALPSPDGQWILGQWSGECEAPTAFFVPITGGEPKTVDGMATIGDGVESMGLGWASDGRAIVQLRGDACGAGADVPGTYLVDPASGARTLVRAASSLSSATYTWRLEGNGNPLEHAFTQALRELGLEGCCGEPSHGVSGATAGVVWDGVDLSVGAQPLAAPATVPFNDQVVSSGPIDIDGAPAIAGEADLGSFVSFTCGDAVWTFGGGGLGDRAAPSTVRAAVAALIPRLYCTVGEPPLVTGSGVP